MSIIAIITARGGSKRIPRKNILPFAGQPMIGYAIKAAQESGIFSEIMVSTEDAEIAAVAQSLGASVPFMRSAQTADDYATTADVLEEVRREYEKRGIVYDHICCIYPCVPLLEGSRLREAFARYQALGCDQLMPVVRFSFPIQRGQLMDEQGWLHYREPECAPKRSQDLPPVFHDAGMFYFQRWNYYALSAPRVGALELSELEVQDIDNPSDLAIAQLKLSLRQQGREGGAS